VTRPRAADDFPMIRARMVELRCERARPRAADDFEALGCVCYSRSGAVEVEKGRKMPRRSNGAVS
jgi:hypothetical protein